MEVLVATIEKRTFTHTSFPKHRGPGRPPSSHIALHAKAAEHFLCNVAHTLAPCTVGTWQPENELALAILAQAIRDLAYPGINGVTAREWFKKGYFTYAAWAAGLDPEYVLRILWEAKVLDSDDRGI
jgi:hypothetical protein